MRPFLGGFRLFAALSVCAYLYIYVHFDFSTGYVA